MTTAYPLSWPEMMPRTKIREGGQFKVTLAAALANVQKALIAFGRDSNMPVKNIIISSNVSLGHESPPDPGIALWFIWDSAQLCIAVDRYQTPRANLQAIYHVLEARRVEMRHGTLALVRATFQGFKALPPPTHWSDVLGVPRNATVQQAKDAHREKAKKAHPDLGGSNASMSELNTALERAIREIG